MGGRGGRRGVARHAGTRLIARSIDTAYRRAGPRWGLAFYTWISVVAFSTGIMTLLAAVPYLDATWAQLATLAPAWAAANTASLVVVVVLTRSRFRSAIAWIGGARSPELAVAAWDELVAELSRFIVMAVGVFSVCAIPAVVVATDVLDLPWYGGVMAALAVEITIVVAALLDYLGFDLLSRPVLRDMAAWLPPTFEPPRPSPPLRARLVAGMTVTSLYGVGLGTAIGATSLSPAVKLSVGLGFAVLMSATLVLFIATLLSDAVVTPMSDLVSAMRAVRRGDLDTRVPLLAADEVGYLAQSFNEMAGGLAERQVLHSAMGMYVAPSVVDRVLSEGADLAGEEIEVTVMFVDIRDFTAASDGQLPRETVGMLNDFFELVVPLVVDYGGHTNKFLGDGLLAAFGAPERFEDHADRALRSAQAILAAVEARYEGSIRIGIGVNSGPVVVGSVGGGGRLEYTLIGDTVNLAQRVEQLTKELGTPLLFTDATRACLEDVPSNLSSQGSIPIRGKRTSIEVHTLSDYAR